jgi:antirestriction protein ArdC
MKRKRQYSFYQLEVLRCRKRLRLARSLDQSVKRLTRWLRRIHDGKMRNDDNALKKPFFRNVEAENFLRSIPNLPKIFIIKGDVRVEKGKVAAFGVYIDKHDQIHIPMNVKKSSIFYPVLFHELIHATGHRKRLNREAAMYNTKKRRIIEELTAELGSVALSVYFGVATHRSMESSALNIFYNLNRMKNDRRFKMKHMYDMPYVNYVREALEFLLIG